MRITYILCCLIGYILCTTSCRPEGTVARVDKESFTIEDQSKIGQELSRHILQNPIQYPIYQRNSYPEIYEYLDLLFETMVNTPEVENRSEFNWQLFVVKNKQSMTAYSLPGGKIYITDGFLKFLENEAQLFAVLSNEMFNTDRGAVMSLLQENYSGVILGDIIYNNPVDEMDNMITTLQLTPLASELTRDADQFSIDLICPFQYLPDALATVFEIEISDTEFPLEWTNIRQTYENRISSIKALSRECSSGGTVLEVGRYADRLLRHLDE